MFGGGGEGGGVGLPGQGPQLRLHLRGAARDARGADLQVDTWTNAKVKGEGTVGLKKSLHDELLYLIKIKRIRNKRQAFFSQ